MAELRCGARLAQEALAHGGVGRQVGPGALQRHVPTEPCVPGAEDDPHSAATDLREDLIVADAASGATRGFHPPVTRDRVTGWAPSESARWHRPWPSAARLDGRIGRDASTPERAPGCQRNSSARWTPDVGRPRLVPVRQATSSAMLAALMTISLTRADAAERAVAVTFDDLPGSPAGLVVQRRRPPSARPPPSCWPPSASTPSRSSAS